MRILHRYIALNLLSAFATSLVVLSFVMMVGLLFKATKYIAEGASFMSVLQFLGFGFPGTLAISIPISALVSTMLVFGRLSADSEISAMRACGVSMRRIMLTPFLLGIVLSGVCFFINGRVAPDSSYARKTFRRIVKTSDVLAVIQPGKSISGLPGLAPDASVFVGSRTNDWLYNVRIQEPLKKSSGMRDIRADSAHVVQQTNGTVRLEMFRVTMSPLQEDHPGVGQAERFQYILGDDLSNRSEAPVRRVKDMRTDALLEERRLTEEHIAGLLVRIPVRTMEKERAEDAVADMEAQRERLVAQASELLELAVPATKEPVEETSGEATPAATGEASPDVLAAPVAESVPEPGTLAWADYQLPRLRGDVERLANIIKQDQTELSREKKVLSQIRTEETNRIVLALASLCFIAVAVPYGLKGQRRESSVGTAICLGVCAVYYLFLVTTESLAKHPEYHPDVISWVPVALCAVLSLHGIGRNT